MELLDKHSKPSFSPIGNSLFRHYLGLELEFEIIPAKFEQDLQKYRLDIIQNCDNILNNGFKDNEKYCIFKDDASLKFGFEICTRPATKDFHKLAFRRFFNEFKNLNISSNITCGTHIHISKTNLTRLQIGKIIGFINNLDNREFIYYIAGRKSCRHSNFNHNQDINSAHRNNFKSGRHYDPVNILNKDSVEIRIFAGVSDLKNLEIKLDFCEALVQYTFAGSRSIKDALDWQIFSKYIESNKSKYLSLNDHLINYKK